MTISENNNNIGFSLAHEASGQLKTIREERGYSIEDLAVTSGLTWQEITDMETGKQADDRLLRRVATALQIPFETLAHLRGAA